MRSQVDSEVKRQTKLCSCHSGDRCSEGRRLWEALQEAYRQFTRNDGTWSAYQGALKQFDAHSYRPYLLCPAIVDAQGMAADTGQVHVVFECPKSGMFVPVAVGELYGDWRVGVPLLRYVTGIGFMDDKRRAAFAKEYGL